MTYKSLAQIVLAAGVAAGCGRMEPEYPADQHYSRNRADDSFLVQAMQYDLEASDMAASVLSLSADTGVKDLANSILQGTQFDEDNLTSLAYGAVKLPASCDQQHAETKATIMALHGRQLDSAYMQYQLTIYNKSVELYKDEIQNGQYQ